MAKSTFIAYRDLPRDLPNESSQMLQCIIYELPLVVPSCCDLICLACDDENQKYCA